MESLKPCRCGSKANVSETFRCFNMNVDLMAYSAYCPSCKHCQTMFYPWDEMAKRWNEWASGGDGDMFQLKIAGRSLTPTETKE